MKTHRLFVVSSAFVTFASGCARLALVSPLLAVGATPKSDLVPPMKRQATVDAAERLSHHKAPERIGSDVRSPFNPADYDKPDGAVAAPSGATGARPPPTVVTPPPPTVATDRETLEVLAAQITPAGSFKIGGKSLLVIGGKRFEVGTKFTATYKDQDYELELIAIEPSTFTLRYRNEEITRPIKPR
jgi:hypothetical protein